MFFAQLVFYTVRYTDLKSALLQYILQTKLHLHPQFLLAFCSYSIPVWYVVELVLADYSANEKFYLGTLLFNQLYRTVRTFNFNF
jgi:hypothetical protein